MNLINNFYSFYILKLIPNFILKINNKQNDIIIYILPKNLIKCLLFFKLHINTQFNILIDVVCIDYPNKFFRFSCVYILLNSNFVNRLFLIINFTELSILSSINFLYNSASWVEREIWDLFGIYFYNNYDLRKLLTDYGFKGHPLRKDFPLTGYVEIRYDDTKKKIITENLELAQEYRNFNFIKTWDFYKK